MSFFNLLLIGIALALDAFGVAISIGLNKKIKSRMKSIFILSFGFFQFFMALVGSLFGFVFTSFITTIPNIIGGILISVVGVLMIKDGFEKKDEDIKISNMMYIVLGVSVSIDALVVGFTAFGSKTFTMGDRIFDSLFIGFVTISLTTIAFMISKKLSKVEIIEKYSNYIGGIILFLFGIKMMF